MGQTAEQSAAGGSTPNYHGGKGGGVGAGSNYAKRTAGVRGSSTLAQTTAGTTNNNANS